MRIKTKIQFFDEFKKNFDNYLGLEFCIITCVWKSEKRYKF